MFVCKLLLLLTWKVENRIEGGAGVPLLEVVEEVGVPPHSVSRIQLAGIMIIVIMTMMIFKWYELCVCLYQNIARGTTDPGYWVHKGSHHVPIVQFF